MTQTKPTLYLDVDGVVNALSPQDGHTTLTIDGFTIRLHPEVRLMIRELAEHFDIVWFTLWNELAAEMIGPHVGLTESPFLQTSWQHGEEAMRARGYRHDRIEACLYAKTPLLAEALTPGQRWVWIDDDHGSADHQYLVEQGVDPRNFRLVPTDPEVGLTWETVRRTIQQVRDLGTLADRAAGGPHRHAPGMAGGRARAVGEPLGPDDFVAGEPCPECGTRLVPVVYGMPAPDVFDMADRGELLIGGCEPYRIPAGCPNCQAHERARPF